MNYTVDINPIVKTAEEGESDLQLLVAEKILAHIDSHLMESGNDKIRISNLLALRSSLIREVENAKSISINP